MKITTSLQKAGGVSALVAAATYLFAMGLLLTVLSPMADTGLHIEQYTVFLTANKPLVYSWHVAMYLINAVCVVILSLALYERIKSEESGLIKIATAFGLIWASFVFLSGFITIHGIDSFIKLYHKNPGQAELLKQTMETITLGIDNSDQFLGCLWVGLVSTAGFKTGRLPKWLSIFGIITGTSGIIGVIFPQIDTVSFVFGSGAVIWWLFLGMMLLKKQNLT
jgi:hypothetical protein